MAEELSVGGRTRSFSIRVPETAGGEIPLVLVLHGNHPDAGGWTMRDWTTFDQQADARGWAVPTRTAGAAAGPTARGWTEVTTQEFDAAEEICRFAEPLLIPADCRRVGPHW